MSSTNPQATPTTGPASAPTHAGSTVADGDGEGPSKEVLRLVAEVLRHLSIAEKNYRLYPSYGKVVRECLTNLHESLSKFQEHAEGALHLKVGQEAFFYEDEEVYREEERGKSLSFRLYKDGVRGVLFFPHVEYDEIASFLSCFKEVLSADEEDDDFGTLFWEKDCSRVQLQLLDDTEASEAEQIPDIPERHLISLGSDGDRFKIPKAEEEHLRRTLEERSEQLEEEQSREFELTSEEISSIQRLAGEEEQYFAIYDFVDVLIELMVTDSSSRSFDDALKLIRNILFGLVENLEFEHAAQVLAKLTNESHPGLTESHLKKIQSLVEGFCDKEVVELLYGYLRESDKLSDDHPVYSFMKALPATAVPHLCEFLRIGRNVTSLVQVLVHLGKDKGAVFEKFLLDPEPTVARLMISVVQGTQTKERATKMICKVLKHPDEKVRREAAKIVHEHGDAKAGPHFVPLLHDSCHHLVSSALLYLSKYPCHSAYEDLASLATSKSLSDMSEDDRCMVVKSMVKSRKGPGMEFINAQLKKPFCFTTRALNLKVASLQALADFDPTAAESIATKFAAKRRSRMAIPARKVIAALASRAMLERKNRMLKEQQETSQQPAKAKASGSAEKTPQKEEVNSV